MAQLGDRAAITGQGHGPAMHDAIKKPALYRVVIARPHDVGGPEAGEGDALAAQPGFGFGLASVAAGGINGAVFIEGPKLAVGIDAGRAHIHKAMGRRPGALDHSAGILKAAARAIDDHIKTATHQRLQPPSSAAVADQVLHPCRRWLVATGKQGEGMAFSLQPLHQRFAHEAGAAHHQDVHAAAHGAAKLGAIQTPG